MDVRYVAAVPVFSRSTLEILVVPEHQPLVFSKSTLVKPVQPKNALLPILVMLSGIVMLVNPSQPENVLLPMLVTPLDIVMLVKPLQPENAAPPKLVTLFGTVMLVKLVQR